MINIAALLGKIVLRHVSWRILSYAAKSMLTSYFQPKLRQKQTPKSFAPNNGNNSGNVGTTKTREQLLTLMRSRNLARKIDINTATRNQLLTLPGIGAADVGLILQRTQNGGGFASLDELAAALNLKPHKVSHLQGKVRFSPVANTTPKSPSADNGNGNTSGHDHIID
jgi:DNA uptake protein ComE-like DNA-binding protein